MPMPVEVTKWLELLIEMHGNSEHVSLGCPYQEDVEAAKLLLCLPQEMEQVKS